MKGKHDTETISKIKADLNSGLAARLIAGKYMVSRSKISFINTGAIHADVEPKTKKQIKMEKIKAQRAEPQRTLRGKVEYPRRLDMQFRHKDDIIPYLDYLNFSSPVTITFQIENDAQRNKFIEILEREQKKHHVELAKITLKIDALETGNWNNLSDGMKVELFAEIEQTRRDKFMNLKLLPAHV